MGSDKGGVRRGDLFNGAYAMGAMTEDRMRYTASRVVESVPAGATFMKLAWTPVIGSVKVIQADGTELVEGKDWNLVPSDMFFDKRLNPNHYDADGKYQGALADPDRNIELGDYDAAVPTTDSFGWRGGYGTKATPANSRKDAIILKDGMGDPAQTLEGLRVAYEYDNLVIPQDDLPILSAHLEHVQLVARARRIAIYYSQVEA